MRAFAFSENPTTLELPSVYTDHWEALWAAIAETDIPVCLHIGSSSKLLRSSPDAPDPVAADGGPSVRAEVRADLEGLGYGAEEVRTVLGALPVEGPVEVLLREALRLLAMERAPRPLLRQSPKASSSTAL